MTTADYALIVSICSGLTALVSLGWNIWSKFIYPKAQLKVTYYTCVVTIGDAPPWPRYLCLSATNFGPTEVTLQSVGILISRGWGKRAQYALVNPIHDIYRPEIGVGPFAGGLPKKLAVGESHSAYFPFDAGSFGRENLVRMSFFDNFNRTHCASRRQVRKVKSDLEEAFRSEPYISTLPPEPVADH